MQSIAAFPAEVARTLEGVCFDIDDTVTTHGSLDPTAYAAMAALREAGLRLVAVTGRPLGFAEIVARTWGVDAAVGENGAGFFAREGRTLRAEYWDDAATRAAQRQVLDAIRAHVARDMPHVQESDDVWARRCDLAWDVGERVSLPRTEIDRLCALIEAQGAKALVSSVHVHAQLGDHDKARGVARALQRLWGVDEARVREHYLFVGDSGNDAPAFRWFAWTAGVANVRQFLDRLPRPPRFVSDASYGAGFAEIAHALLRLRAAAP